MAIESTKNKNFNRLKELLFSLFQLDRGDLDFGIYRIMKLKNEEIREFLDKNLLPQINEVLQEIQFDDISALQAELDQLIESAKSLDINIEDNAKIQSLKQRISAGTVDIDRAEADIYNYLVDFFSRYYSEGDYLSLRRYSSQDSAKYLIPHDGQETNFYWANSDQFYIKSTENYTSYIFIVEKGNNGDRKVCFETVSADEKEGQRRFMLAEGESAVLQPDDSTLIVRFEHRLLSNAERKQFPGTNQNQQERINSTIEKTLLNTVNSKWKFLLACTVGTESNPNRTLLAKHLSIYTAKNTYDYFIHKNLKSFLQRELDYFLKSEVLNLDDIDISDDNLVLRTRAKVRAIRLVGSKIIQFVSQIENFQKSLWLKKKFVLESNYCITLDRIPLSLYAEILANKTQLKEWIDLFAVDEIPETLFTKNPSKSLDTEFLKSNPHLVLDTKHFDQQFKDKLLEEVSANGSLDEQLLGLLIHGDNFQALNLIQTRYQNQIRAIYIDPPYNTDASPIIYKNNYKDSSWLSLMENRLGLSANLLSDSGIICVAIDDEEQSKLKELLDSIFTKLIGIAPVRSNPAGRKTKGRLAPAHEYAMFYGISENSIPGSLSPTKDKLAAYPHTDSEGCHYTWTNFIRSGSGQLRTDRPKMYFPIYVDVKANKMRVPSMTWSEERGEYIINEAPKQDEVEIYPQSIQNGTVVEKRWHRGYKRAVAEIEDYRFKKNGEQITIQFKAYMDENSVPKTWWEKKKYASATHGAKELKALFGRKLFDFPKATKLVVDCIDVASCNDDNAVILDFFAGSGTSAHAVINLNKSDGGKRKFILVEVGRHFDDVVLPRIKKAIYCDEWKNGKPVSRTGGVSHFFQYLVIESYEDTLDSLELKPKSNELLTEIPQTLAEDYRLRYSLSTETSQSHCLLGSHFTNPFNYTLSVIRYGIRREVVVDLPETFNFLIGLRIHSRQHCNGLLVISGIDSENNLCLILWRNIERFSNASLEEWLLQFLEKSTSSFELIYANGDHNLNALSQTYNWTAKAIEPVFREKMFDASAI